MTITKNDIKLFQAQDNTDNDSGGGARTANEVFDGAVNNLFPDISRIDTVSGDVALRKVFPTVVTKNQDVYYGAHALIRKSPTDPNVSSLLFHTDNPYDQRIEAQDAIESYVVASYLEEFYLYGNHVTGAKAVTFLQNIESPLPNVGEVYLLKEGIEEQYVRVAGLDVQEVNLVYTSGTSSTSYLRRRIICEIDQPLEFAFKGSSFHPSGQTNNTANTWATQVADAAKFYATKTLLIDAAVGDFVIKVDSIFEQLVPASKKQTPIINKFALVQGVSLIPTGNLVTKAVIVSANYEDIEVGTAITPNSITRMGSTIYQDDGLGNIIDTNSNNVIVGSVIYEKGIISQSVSSNNTYIDYEVALSFDADIQYTGEIKITQENVGNVFIKRLSPIPAIGELYIDYRSNGKWYRFASSGNRTAGNEPLGGVANIGAGSLDDNTDGTGTVNITLASTPDIDSSIIISWGSGDKLTKRTDLIAAETQAAMIIDLGQTNIDPLSFVMQVYSPLYATFKNVTALSDGTLADDATPSLGLISGTLDFHNGKVAINKLTNPNRIDVINSVNNMVIDFNYSTVAQGNVGAIKTAVADPDPSGNELPFLSGAIGTPSFSFELGESVALDGLRIYMQTSNPDYPTSSAPFVLESDSAGTLRRWSRSANDTTTYGMVTQAGVVSITLPTYEYSYLTVGYFTGFGQTARYEPVTKPLTLSPLTAGGYVRVKYQTGSPASFPNSHNITDKYENISHYEIQTLPSIAGEVNLEFLQDGNAIYSKNGNMYDGNDLNIGSIDYAKGVITLQCFHRPYDMYLKFNSLFTDEIGDEDGKVYEFTFRTAATKLTTSSFNLSYQTANGNFIATSDGNGVITGTDIDSVKSYVDTQTGMANIVFTEQTVASSIKYDAVAESSLPLDPELLGLNPVRLPSDGRVPVFKAGYHVIIFNEVTTPTTNATPLANDTQTLARVGQAYIEIIDTEGKRLDPVQYIVNRDTGVVTFSPALVLEDKYGNGLTGPFYIVDRVEDMVLATDVQINGLITLSAGLSYDYTQGVTKVASVLVWGDTGARVYNQFSQEIWDNGNPNWSDFRVGDNTTSQYDFINNPVLIDNESSTSGRWAIIFTSGTTVKVAHEKLGVVQDNISISIEDVEPINPSTGLPYFIMNRSGFGAGWLTNNVIRFNTDSGDNNMWVIRTVKSGKLTEEIDNIDIEVRGDAN